MIYLGDILTCNKNLWLLHIYKYYYLGESYKIFVNNADRTF